MLFHSHECSIICFSTNICSIQDFLFLNPVCSWQSISSTASVMRCCMMRMKTLLVRKRIVMDNSWLQFPRSPFLGSLIDYDSFLLCHLGYPLYPTYLRGYVATCRVFLFILLSESWDIHHLLLGLYLFLVYELHFSLIQRDGAHFYFKVCICVINVREYGWIWSFQNLQNMFCW